MGVLEVILNLVDNMTPGLEAASTAVDNLENNVNTASDAIDNINPDQLVSVQDAANAAGLDMQQVGEAASMAGFDISNIDPTAVKETSDNAKEASDSANEMASGFGMVESAVSALVGIGLAAWLDEIVNAAGNFQDSWSRIDVAMDGTINGIDATQSQWSSAISQMRDVTGRGAGDIRNFIIDMGIAGVDSQEVITGSFEAVAGAAFITGKSVDTISTSFSNIVKNGMLTKRNIASLGLSTQDVMDATGKSIEEVSSEFKNMSPEARAAFLEAIYGAKYGTSANEAYKNSWAKVKDQLGLAFDYINRIVGGLILPLLIPALEFVTGLLNTVAGAISNLNPIIKTIAGFVLLVGGAFVSLYLILSPIISILGSLIGPILGNFITMIMAAGGGVEGLIAVLGGLLGSIGPVGWAILVVIGIIASAILIWQTWSKEIIAFKDAISSGDWGSAAGMIVSAFNYVGGAIYDSLVYAGQQIWIFFANLPAWIGSNATAWLNMGRDFMMWLLQGLTSLSSYLSTVLTDMMTAMATDGSAQSAGTTAGQSTGKGIIDGIKQWLIDNAPLLKQTFVLLFQQLMPIIGQLILQLSAIVALWMYQTAIRIGQQFLNGILQFIYQLPGLAAVGLLQTLLTIVTWGYQVWSYALWAGSMLLQGFISWLSQLPGTAWMYFLAFLNYLGQLPGIAYGYAASTGSAIVSAIGSYLSSLPGQMYSWGMNALSRFVNGIIDTIPGLRAALDTVRSLFPASPPKEGPLSEIKPENMESWMSGIVDAASTPWDGFSLGNVVNGKSSSSSKSSSGVSELKITLIHDFENVPEGMDESTLLKTLQALTRNTKFVDLFVRMLTKQGIKIKLDSGG